MRRWLVVLATLLLLLIGAPAMATTGGSGGSPSDQTFLTFTNSADLTGDYHLYAGGLNWSDPVGLLVYTDGSGDYGLNNPTDEYLLAGVNGLIAVAKEHNMVLLTPFAPGDGCYDGDGTCWYMHSYDGTRLEAKTRWSYDLIKDVQSRYDIDLQRVALAGYSSGAQWLTQYFGPAHAPQVMEDGVAVAISYGGRPMVTPTYTDAFTAAVPFVWDVGADDPSYTTTSQYGVNAGYNWYTAEGFTTQRHVIPGKGHDRSGEFGAIVDREITEHVSATGSPAPPPAADWDTTVTPTRTGGTFSVTVPSGYSGRVYVRLSSGNYLYERATGPTTVNLTFKSQRCGDTMAWTVQAPNGTQRKYGEFTTLPC